MNCLLVGCGAIGSNLSAYLASDIRDQHHVTIVDFDNVSERNIQAGTQFFLKEQIGLPKIEALQYNIYKQLNRTVAIINTKITKNNFVNIFLINGMKYDLIIDTCDNYEARKAIT